MHKAGEVGGKSGAVALVGFEREGCNIRWEFVAGNGKNPKSTGKCKLKQF